VNAEASPIFSERLFLVFWILKSKTESPFAGRCSWSDNCKARLLNIEVVNQYKPRDNSDKKVRSQIEIYDYLKRKKEVEEG